MPPALKELIENSRLVRLPKGQIILYEADMPTEAFFIKDGIIKIYNIDEAGNENILHIVGDGGMVPFALFSGKSIATQWFYTTVVSTEVYRINYDDLQKTMEADGATALYLTHWFSREVHELLTRLYSMGRTNVKDKLLAALKFLAVRHSTKQRDGWLRVNFPVSHQLLADMTGISRESAATAMKELSDAGVVRNPRLTVLEINMQKLIG